MKKILKNRLVKFFALVILLTLVLSACGQEDRDAPKGIFYKVLGGQNEMYILGSVHLGSEDMYPLDYTIETAYNTSSILVVEANTNEIEQEEINRVLQEYAFFQDDSVLTDYIDNELFQEIKNIIPENVLDEQVLIQLKPWYISQIITQMAQENTKYDFKYGVDQYFINRAGSKEIIGLETVKEQFEPYTKMDMDTSIKYLKNSIDQRDNMEENLTNLISHWYDGDYETVASLKEEVRESIDTESYQKHIDALLDKRDYNMAQKLDSMIKHDIDNQYFVVVGYLHLSGENSLITYLENLGYTLEIAN
ncbi:MAG: TraB/GumN family protein [Halanaerobiales bacterium]